ncbi:unnamed protein product [Rotaria sp. Silwood2]|nr:unnamed protein product [Rotaria sp. Silwood2]CAF4003434.1 unnamed protein product [Rotaria sp. Silwood2]
MEENTGKTEREKKFMKSFEETLKQREKKDVENKVLIDSITNVFKTLSSTGKEIREDEKKQQTDYFKQLLDYVNSLNVKEGLLYLQNEKIKYEQKLITANIERHGYAIRFYENIINIIVKPLITIWEEKSKQPEEKASIISAKSLEIKSLPSKETKNDLIIKEEFPIANIAPIGEHINCNASKQQIRDYFYILTTENNPINDKPYMLKEDVDLLIRTNFTAFGEPPTGSYFNINLTTRQKGVLRYFIYQFYLKYEFDQIGTKPQYVNFLIRNFTLFKNDNPASLDSNMNVSKKPSARNIIPISR